ncbi:major facilitator superfamily domain-containing protein [Trichoderma barbatum]
MSLAAGSVTADGGVKGGKLSHLPAVAQEPPSDNNSDVEKGVPPSERTAWESDLQNPQNWPSWRKISMVVMISAFGFTVSLATSILSSSKNQLMVEFNVSATVAILPLTLYTLALGLGPVIGGPLSETVGRYPVYVGSLFLGAIFTLGAGFVHNFGALCFLRFLAGIFWAPVFSLAPGTFAETFTPKVRGPVSSIFILMPFLGPGLGPVIGSFATTIKGWRWDFWTLLFFAIFCMILTPFLKETFHPVLKRQLARKRGEPAPPLPPVAERMRKFIVIAVARPILMLFTEPIVTFICLYAAVSFGILFSFFAGVPYTFGKVYSFSIEESGLVFLSIVIGCLIGLATIIACDIFLYRKQISNYPPHRVPPEYRLYPALIGSFGLPIGLFWFAWTARPTTSWASPAAAIIPFAWGNICVFVSTVQYITDTYTGNTVASASSSNSLARYAFAAVFPLFTIQMYEKLGVGWAASLLGFITVALLPIPWALFRYGPSIRAKSQFETVRYEN